MFEYFMYSCGYNEFIDEVLHLKVKLMYLGYTVQPILEQWEVSERGVNRKNENW